MQTIHYPNKRKVEEAVTQHTLDCYITHIDNWMQHPGAMGQLLLHGCWGTASVLERRYQGETVSTYNPLMEMAQELYDRFGDPVWRIRANSMAAHLLHLQDECGCFIHSTNEFEPTFDTRGCPIHYYNPIIALCRYYDWQYADPTIKSLIPDAIQRHEKWIAKNIWQIGNGRHRPLDFPGWCGVTNQDLTVIVAMAMIGKTFGDWHWFDTYGRPSLEHYLSPAYYYKEIGGFERGDGTNFCERSPYLNIIMSHFKTLAEMLEDPQYLEVADNVADHLFDLLYEETDGLLHISRGVITDEKDKSKIYGFDRSSISFESYPGLILHLQDYLTRHPDPERSAKVQRLKETVAAYMYVDGCIPQAFRTKNDYFALTSRPSVKEFFDFIMSELGDTATSPKLVKLPAIHRSLHNQTWKQNGRWWAIEEDGVRKFGGYTRFPGNITIGPEETPIYGSYDVLDDCDVLELIDFE